jgi:hypothetical protein
MIKHFLNSGTDPIELLLEFLHWIDWVALSESKRMAL